MHQIAVSRFKLEQRRYKNGSFFVSVTIDDGNLIALDGRYFVEEGESLIPTKNGFRIPAAHLEQFKKTLSHDPKEIGDMELFESQAFKFFVRYVDDKYGRGVDFRKYRTGEKYTGWDRAGIRMTLPDSMKLADYLKSTDFTNIDTSKNLFLGKEISSKKSAERGENNKSKLSEINPILRELLALDD